MVRRPPRSTRTDTLFPYTTLFRSGPRCLQHCSRTGGADAATQWESTTAHLMQILQESIGTSSPNTDAKAVAAALPFMMRQAGGYFRAPDRDVQAITHQLREGIRRLDSIVRTRSEERRVGKEWVSQFRSGWLPEH